MDNKHEWTPSGFCGICHYTHRTDFRRSDICKVKVRLAGESIVKSVKVSDAIDTDLEDQSAQLVEEMTEDSKDDDGMDNA